MTLKLNAVRKCTFGKGMYERAKVQMENLSANHDNLRRKCEQLQERMSAIAMSIHEETDIQF